MPRSISLDEVNDEVNDEVSPKGNYRGTSMDSVTPHRQHKRPQPSRKRLTDKSRSTEKTFRKNFHKQRHNGDVLPQGAKVRPPPVKRGSKVNTSHKVDSPLSEASVLKKLDTHQNFSDAFNSELLPLHYAQQQAEIIESTPQDVAFLGEELDLEEISEQKNTILTARRTLTSLLLLVNTPKMERNRAAINEYIRQLQTVTIKEAEQVTEEDKTNVKKAKNYLIIISGTSPNLGTGFMKRPTRKRKHKKHKSKKNK